MDRLPKHSGISLFQDEYNFNKEKCQTSVKQELENLTIKITKKKGYFSGWFGGSSKNVSRQDKIMESVVMNEKVQDQVGRGIAKMAVNEQVQSQVGDSISKVIFHEKFYLIF
jgi:hypothetical protein